jgi:hypothetical protein
MEKTPLLSEQPPLRPQPTEYSSESSDPAVRNIKHLPALRISALISTVRTHFYPLIYPPRLGLVLVFVSSIFSRVRSPNKSFRFQALAFLTLGVGIWAILQQNATTYFSSLGQVAIALVRYIMKFGWVASNH